MLMKRRNRTRVPSHSYDIVIGPIANDSVGFQIRCGCSWESGNYKGREELKYMKGVTMQYFFGTEKSIRYLTKVSGL